MTKIKDEFERLSAIEVDVKHLTDNQHSLESAIKSVEHSMQEGFDNLRHSISAQKQPLTAYAGLGSLILVLVFTYTKPMISDIDDLKITVEEIKKRELDDAKTSGRLVAFIEKIQDHLIKERNDEHFKD